MNKKYNFFVSFLALIYSEIKRVTKRQINLIILEI